MMSGTMSNDCLANFMHLPKPKPILQGLDNMAVTLSVESCVYTIKDGGGIFFE